MIGPIERTVLQGIGNVLLDSRLEIFDICISEPGIFELADIETELGNHRLEASNAQLRVRVSKIDVIVAVIADEKVGNR